LGGIGLKNLGEKGMKGRLLRTWEKGLRGSLAKEALDNGGIPEMGGNPTSY